MLQELFREFDLVFFYQRFAGGFALRFQEGVGHAAADDQHVDFGQQVLDDADLVADFGSAEDGDKGTLGILKCTTQIFQLFFHQQAGGGFLDELRDAYG